MSRCSVSVSVFLFALFVAFLGGSRADAQGPLGNDQYAFKIYAVNSFYYPIIQVYLRTWDQNREPLANVNYMNIGLQVKGKNYDPALIDPQSRRTMYGIETLQNRDEAFRTVLVLDCSRSMEGKPFADAQTALTRFVEAKRSNDQIAILAIRDTDQGYELVSPFEKDLTMLYQRIADIKCDGMKTRLYDSVAAAMEMCATASQGGFSNAGAEFTVLNAIVVLSDGKDEGSAVSREELMARIGQLPLPIPIFSLAYAKSDKSDFLNLEALSKGSFGQYWTHEDSQQLSATVQKIHQINRADYVVTFRSTIPVDGAKHAFKLGISWPANTGRAVFESGEFEAIDSPAAFSPTARTVWESLQMQYPDLTNLAALPVPAAPPLPVPSPNGGGFDAERQSALTEKSAAEQRFADAGAKPEESADYRQGNAAMTQADAAAAKGDAATAATGYKDAAVFFAKAEPTVKAASQTAGGGEDAMDVLKKNAPLIGVGAGLVILVVAVLVWTRRSGSSSHDPYSDFGGKDTRQRRTSNLGAPNRTRDTGNDPTKITSDSDRLE